MLASGGCTQENATSECLLNLKFFFAHPLKLNPRSAANIYIYIYNLICTYIICIYNIYYIYIYVCMYICMYIYIMINLIFIWKTSLENILSKFQFFWASSLCHYVIMICGVCSICISLHPSVLEVQGRYYNNVWFFSSY